MTESGVRIPFATPIIRSCSVAEHVLPVVASRTVRRTAAGNHAAKPAFASRAPKIRAEGSMRHNYRMTGAAVIATAVLVAAGWSAAADRNDVQQQVAQASVTGTEGVARSPAADTSATVIEKEDVQAILGRQVLSS